MRACFRSFASVPFVLSFALAFAVGGCSSGGGGGGGGGDDGPNETVEEVLEAFGIDTAETKRVDNDGDDLPDGYTPLGTTRTINKFSEIMLFGVPLDDTPATTGRMVALNLLPVAGNDFDWEVLHDEPEASTPWFPDDTTARAAINGDFDADGMDEIAIVYQIDTNDPVRLVIMQDFGDGFTFSTPQVVDSSGHVDELFVTAGDFDGDGSIDLAVGLVVHGQASRIVMFANTSGVLGLTGTTLSIPNSTSSSTQMVLTAGNVDWDSAVELAVVINESGNGGHSRYFVYDDATTDFAELKSGQTVIDTGSGVVTAKSGNIALADVDGDNLDEVLLAGLDLIGSQFNSNNRGNYLLEVFDDAKQNFARLAGSSRSAETGSLQPSASGANHRLSYVHVIGVDLDGDGAKEIATNQFVYQDLRESPGAISPITYDHDNDSNTAPIAMEIDTEEFFAYAGASAYDFTWRSSSVAAGDVTSDKRENLVYWSQRDYPNGARTQGIMVYGIDQIAGWGEIEFFESDFANFQNPYRGQLLLPDLDLDNESAALQYSAGSYRYVLTEPILVAALAAAPCATDLGQDLSSCRTAFGQAVSDTTTRTNGWSFIAGVSVGFDGTVPFVGGPEVVLNTQNTLRSYTSEAYTLKKTILRETGPIEDSVIFVTVPIDIYTYDILSHPNPDLIGEKIEVRMPREPIEVMTTTEIYNDNVEPGAFKIDAGVFEHTVGDPQTYPTTARRNQLLNQFDGLIGDDFDVGAGGGRTTVTISEFTTTTRGRSYEFQATLDLKYTGGGIIGGFKIGGGLDTAVEITHGDENIYQGTVSNIAPEFFPQEVYHVGLFSYFYEPSGTDQTFEVVNYWVD